MRKLKLLTAVLDLFDGEGAPGASSPDAGESMGESVNAEAGDASQQESKPEKVPFKDLINGEYKAEFDEIFKRRLKDYKELQKKVADQDNVMSILMGKYKAEDLESLAKAIEDDDAMWESAAYEAGMTTEQYKAYQKLERENSRLRQQEQQAEAERQAQQQVARWRAEAMGLKNQFPDFDLEQELTNEKFKNLIRPINAGGHGLDMETAYKMVHFNDLMQNTAYSVATATEKKVTDNIRAKGNRPVENGTTSQSAFTIKSDPTKWTKKDRAEIARRAARGEKITI